MDMSQLNAAIEAEKQRAQTLRIEQALSEILATVTALREEVAELKAKRNGPSLDELTAKYEEKTPLKAAKRLGEKTTQE